MLDAFSTLELELDEETLTAPPAAPPDVVLTGVLVLHAPAHAAPTVTRVDKKSTLALRIRSS